MSKLTISEAARQIPMSRSTLYKTYIKPGKISIEKDENGKPKIDYSELLRVFPGLQGDLSSRTGLRTESDRLEDSSKAEVLEERIKGLEALLLAKNELIESQQQRLLICEKKFKKKRFWFF